MAGLSSSSLSVMDTRIFSNTYTSQATPGYLLIHLEDRESAIDY
jgi:hypothetical protein